jgi:hypothetical protein
MTPKGAAEVDAGESAPRALHTGIDHSGESARVLGTPSVGARSLLEDGSRPDRRPVGIAVTWTR